MGTPVSRYYPSRTKPRRHQREAEKQALKKDAFALFMAPRTGKTLVALRVIGHRGYKRVLVVCPKTAKYAWRNNIRKHCAYRFRVRLQMPEGGLRGLRKSMHVDDTSTHFLILNFEPIRRYRRILGRIKWDAIIVDESHRIKNRNSQQSKAVYYIARDSKPDYRMIMTGTFQESDELDLWAQFRFLQPKLFGDVWSKFEKRWCRKTGYQLRKRAIKKHLRNEFIDRIAPYCFVLNKEEVMNFPSEDVPVYLELPPKVRRIYDTLHKEFVVTYKDEKVVTPFIMTKMTRLHQIAGGHLVTDEATHVIDRTKLNATVEIVEDVKDQVLIFCRYLDEIKLIYERLSKISEGGILIGGMTEQEREQVRRDFHERRKLKWLVAQIATGGASIDLFSARTGIFYSKDFSRINYLQARARLDSLSQTSTTFFHLTQKKTIDTDLDAALRRKGRVADYVFKRLKKEY